jgi:hypothetical protein
MYTVPVRDLGEEPQFATIQYAAARRLNRRSLEYWDVRSRLRQGFPRGHAEALAEAASRTTTIFGMASAVAVRPHAPLRN